MVCEVKIGAIVLLMKIDHLNLAKLYFGEYSGIIIKLARNHAIEGLK